MKANTFTSFLVGLAGIAFGYLAGLFKASGASSILLMNQSVPIVPFVATLILLAIVFLLLSIWFSKQSS